MATLTFESVLISFVSVFTIINPIGTTPFFLGHTNGLGAEQSKKIARRASLACALVLISFALFGTFIFKLMGITLPAFRIAGGLLVFNSAWSMLSGANVRSRTLPEEQKDADQKEDISIIPLAIPLLSGPGAISTVMVLEARTDTTLESLIVYAAILFASAMTYIILTHSSILVRVIGSSGIRVMNRILGLLLSAIAIQFIINGVKGLYPEFVALMQS
jgi:multiple antibiotic resistance protein